MKWCESFARVCMGCGIDFMHEQNALWYRWPNKWDPANFNQRAALKNKPELSWKRLEEWARKEFDIRLMSGF